MSGGGGRRREGGREGGGKGGREGGREGGRKEEEEEEEGGGREGGEGGREEKEGKEEKEEEFKSLYYCQAYIFCGAGERKEYVLQMMVTKPQTVLYRAPTFSLLASWWN